MLLLTGFPTKNIHYPRKGFAKVTPQVSKLKLPLHIRWRQIFPRKDTSNSQKENEVSETAETRPAFRFTRSHKWMRTRLKRTLECIPALTQRDWKQCFQRKRSTSFHSKHETSNKQKANRCETIKHPSHDLIEVIWEAESVVGPTETIVSATWIDHILSLKRWTITTGKNHKTWSHVFLED